VRVQGIYPCSYTFYSFFPLHMFSSFLYSISPNSHSTKFSHTPWFLGFSFLHGDLQSLASLLCMWAFHPMYCGLPNRYVHVLFILVHFLLSELSVCLY